MTDFLVLEGHSPAQVSAAADELGGELGGEVVVGFRRPPRGGSVVCVGRIATAQDAASAVLAAVGGARLVIDAAAPRETVDRLCDDLRRLGALDHRVGAPSGPVLDADQRALLALLLGGATLGQAAATLHLSRRTADRRLAGARAVLGAGSTSEAVAAAARLGVRPARAR